MFADMYLFIARDSGISESAMASELDIDISNVTGFGRRARQGVDLDRY